MSNYKPKVGLITFGDERQYEWEKVFKNLTVPRHDSAIEYFSKLPIDLIVAESVARTRAEIREQVDHLLASKVDVLVAHVPCWTSPNLVVYGIQRLNLPTILLSNKSPATHGTVGYLGAAGALDQIGYSFIRVREDFENEDAISKNTIPYIRAAFTVTRLRGMVFGMFGGRALGIDTGTIDPMQWRAMFGVDVEYIDQLEIIRRADLVLDQPVEDTMKWLSENVNRIDYDGNKLTPEKLAFQIRCYLATKEIIKEKELDFVAIQCMPDLSTHYVPQCISAAFLPGPYDAQGSKEPVAMACEADGDGALTMEILKQVSGGKPVLFGDLSYINESKSVIYIPNCGALCTWYAARSDHPNENLKKIQLRPAVRPGGGAITYFTAAPGPITLARLYRKAGKYFMVIISGEAIDLTPQDLNEFVQARGAHQLPTAFIKVNADINEILGTIGSNHISGVAGLYINEIVHFCELLGIEYKVFSDVGSQD